MFRNLSYTMYLGTHPQNDAWDAKANEFGNYGF